MKTCCICKIEKTTSLFNKNKSKKDLLQPHCRDCSKHLAKVHYSKNKKYYRDKANNYRGKVRAVYEEYFKDKVCADCGESDRIVLEHDHLPGTIKLRGVSQCLDRGLAPLMQEIAKCDVVCCNCHRRRTAKRAGWRSTYVYC